MKGGVSSLNDVQHDGAGTSMVLDDSVGDGEGRVGGRHGSEGGVPKGRDGRGSAGKWELGDWEALQRQGEKGHGRERL